MIIEVIGIVIVLVVAYYTVPTISNSLSWISFWSSPTEGGSEIPSTEISESEAVSVGYTGISWLDTILGVLQRV